MLSWFFIRQFFPHLVRIPGQYGKLTPIRATPEVEAEHSRFRRCTKLFCAHTAIHKIEVEPEEMGRLLAERRVIVARFKETGFSYVTLDLVGYRSGSIDEVL